MPSDLNSTIAFLIEARLCSGVMFSGSCPMPRRFGLVFVHVVVFQKLDRPVPDGIEKRGRGPDVILRVVQSGHHHHAEADAGLQVEQFPDIAADQFAALFRQLFMEEVVSRDLQVNEEEIDVRRDPAVPFPTERAGRSPRKHGSPAPSTISAGARDSPHSGGADRRRSG